MTVRPHDARVRVAPAPAPAHVPPALPARVKVAAAPDALHLSERPLAEMAIGLPNPESVAAVKQAKTMQNVGTAAIAGGLGAIGVGIWAVLMVPWGVFAACMLGGAALAGAGAYLFFKGTMRLAGGNTA